MMIVYGRAKPIWGTPHRAYNDVYPHIADAHLHRPKVYSRLFPYVLWYKGMQ